MTAIALRQEVSDISEELSEAQLFSAVMYMRFLKQQGEPELHGRDFETINANAERLNRGAEENLEFQADFWEDE